MIDFNSISSVVGAVFLISGWVLILMQSLGMVVLKNIYSRMLIAGLTDCSGLILVFVGLMLYSDVLVNIWKMILFLVFLILTSPVTIHLIARSARKNMIGLSPRRGARR